MTTVQAIYCSMCRLLLLQQHEPTEKRAELIAALRLTDLECRAMMCERGRVAQVQAPFATWH